MKAPDPLFQWRIHFWYFHAPRRGIAPWKTKEGEEVPRKAAVITEMMIILTMRLAEIPRFLWQERPFLRRRKKQLMRSTKGCNSEGRKERRKRAIKHQGEVEEHEKRKKTLGRKINYIKWQLITDLRLKLRTLES